MSILSDNGRKDGGGFERSSNNTVPWGTKAKYLSAGIVIGVAVAPWIRKVWGQVQPKVDDLVDQLTGKTEEVAEKASDLLAQAKQRFQTIQTQKSEEKKNTSFS